MFVIEYWHGPMGWEFAIRNLYGRDWILRSKVYKTMLQCTNAIDKVIRDLCRPNVVYEVQRITTLVR